MDLSTVYLGFRLPHPFMPGASPMVDSLDTVRRLEDAGAAAIVMHSLFEEQVLQEQVATTSIFESSAESFPEALSFFPEPDEFALGPEEYLHQLARVREAVDVPVFASLNGIAGGHWLEYAWVMQEAGADGIELNTYQLATDPTQTAEMIERQVAAMVMELKEKVQIPVAVKLSPFYTATANFARRLERAGADALVLFNRFYQADIDVEELEVERTLHLSDSSELLLRLRWLAILSSQLELPLAVSGGVHAPVDAVKAVMSGAHAIQVVSALLERGPEYLATLRRGLEEWMEEHRYASLAELRGTMNLSRCPDPAAYERANYMRILQGYRAPGAPEAGVGTADLGPGPHPVPDPD